MSDSLPPGWVTTSLGALCDEKVSQAPPTVEPVPYIDISSVDRSTKRVGETTLVTLNDAPTRARQWVRTDDVLVSMTRPNLNAVAQVGPYLDGAVASTGFDVLRSRVIDPRWIFYRVRTNDFVGDMCEDLQGVVYPAIRPLDVRRHELPLPPLSEQHRIVSAIESYFSRLDEAVVSLERVQRNLKRYRASVLKAAVEGRLVPTEAELARAEGRSYEPASVLLVRILAERRRRWEEAELAKMKAKGKVPKDDRWRAKYVAPIAPDTSELPELPEGWWWASWEQVGFSQNGRSFPSKEYRNQGVRLLRPGNLHFSGRVEWNRNNTRCMPQSWAREFPEFLVGPGELVMNLTAQSLKDEFLGRVCLTGGAECCLLNQRIARLTPMVLRTTFFLYWLKTPLFRAFVDRLNTGSLIQHMFTSQLDAFAFPLPPLVEQDRIIAALERLLGIAETIDRDIQQSECRVPKLRQSVLRRAFEGRLVDQDPTDEPASALLERIRAERESSSDEPPRRPRRAKARAPKS